MSITVAVDLVCDVDGCAAALRDSHSALLCGLQVPDGVFVFGMCHNLGGGHGPGGGCHIEYELGMREGMGGLLDWMGEYNQCKRVETRNREIMEEVGSMHGQHVAEYS